LNVELGVVVSVRLLELPVATLTEVADGVSENVGAIRTAAATVMESVFCWLIDPLIAETVAE
jgi:hypothetical protein